MSAEDKVVIGPVLCIDVGSNSIKSLVAGRSDDGNLVVLEERTLEVRISAGISKDAPVLEEDAMRAGIEAIESLAEEAAAFRPVVTVVTATSAVRDARNKEVFCSWVKEAIRADLQILTGEEEARLIATGVASDDALSRLSRFRLADLGGGSLEVVDYEDGRITWEHSFQLGAVRLTEQFGSAPQAEGSPRLEEVRKAVAAVLRSAMPRHEEPWPLVLTGGAATVTRFIQARANGDDPASDGAASVTTVALRDLLNSVESMDADALRRVDGLPHQRVDIYPTALATLLALLEECGATSACHSFRNLRFGVAAECLAQLAEGS